jgi:hypothetical protein
MTAEWYDLGQRLYAASAGHVVARLAGSAVRPARNPVAVRARRRGPAVTVTAAPADGPAVTATGSGALDMLHDLGVRITAGVWATLITDDDNTLPALTALAGPAPRDGQHAAVAAHLAWWADRSDFTGSTAIVPLVAGCRERWITGSVPGAERSAATWRAWLGVTDDGCAGMHAILGRLQDGGPLALLDAIQADDARSWTQAQRDHADLRDWRTPDSTGRAAIGLRSRCDSADLYAAALLTDPLYRRRGVHTGHVVTGQATVPAGRRREMTVTCDRMDARLRAGSDITGWAGLPADPQPSTFAGTVTATAVRGGLLVLDLASVGINKPASGDRVTLIPAAPSPKVIESGQRRYQGLYGTRTSWLVTGRHPAPARRDVPLDVLVASAGD